MYPFFLNRKPTARRNAARRWFCLAAALFVGLMILSPASAGRLPAQTSTDHWLAPFPLAPIGNEYVTPPSVTFRWSPADGDWGYDLEIRRVDKANKLEIHVPGSDTSYTYSGLEPGYTYIWSVKASNGPGDQGDSALFTLADQPIPPTTPGISASDGTSTREIEIQWSSSYHTAYYLLQRRAPGSADFIDLARVGEERAYTDTEPEAEQRYLYRVLACNIAGCSQPSEADEGYVGTCHSIPAPQLLQPQDGAEIHITRQDPEYYLEWQYASDETEFWVVMWGRNTNYYVLQERTGSDTYVVYGLSGDLSWKVIAINPTDGCPNSPPSESRDLLVIMDPPPAIPVNLQASDGAYPDQVVLTWEQPASTSNLESWQIWRSTDSDLQTAKEIYALYPDTESPATYTDKDITPGTTYYYWIEACSHSDGCSEKSTPDTGFARASPLELDNSTFLPIMWW